MICSFFKKIGLSIALFCSSFSGIFNYTKPIKRVNSLTKEQVANSEFVVKKDEVIDIPVIVERTVKEKIKELELILDNLYFELEKLKRERRKEKKALKAEKKELQYQQWKKDQKEVMDKIDVVIARTPKDLPRYTQYSPEDKPVSITYIPEDVPNEILV